MGEQKSSQNKNWKQIPYLILMNKFLTAAKRNGIWNVAVSTKTLVQLSVFDSMVVVDFQYVFHVKTH